MTDGFEFLGFHVTMHWDKRYGYGPRVEIPKARAVDLRRRIKQLTTRNTIQVSLGEKLQEINLILRGWANYYRYCAYAGRVFTGLDWYIRDRLWRWMRKKRPRAGARDILGAFLPSTRRADSTALARWPGRAAHARLDPGLPVPSCMDEDAGLRLVFWRAGCVTKGARPVREEATRNRPLRGGAALVAYFT